MKIPDARRKDKFNKGLREQKPPFAQTTLVAQTDENSADEGCVGNSDLAAVCAAWCGLSKATQHMLAAACRNEHRWPGSNCLSACQAIGQN
jgi:hypothetical protein